MRGIGYHGPSWRYPRFMAIKAICVDERDTHHLIIGLNRENIASILNGEVLTLPPGAVPLTADGEITIVFAETDKALEKCFPPMLRPS